MNVTSEDAFDVPAKGVGDCLTDGRNSNNSNDNNSNRIRNNNSRKKR